MAGPIVKKKRANTSSELNKGRKLADILLFVDREA